MIPILYSASEQDFTTMGLGALNEATSCEVHTVLNGMFELEMKYPVTGRRYSDLQISCVIKAVAEKNGTPQLFDIYAITKPMSGIVTVYASHVSGRKQFIPIMPCSAMNVVDAFAAIDAAAAETNPFTFWTDKGTAAKFELTVPAPLGSVLGGMSGSILDVYRGEYEFDNFTIKLYNNRGGDNGVTLRYGKNITSIEQEESIASTVTGVCPYWADIDGNNVLTLPEKVVESPTSANFPFKRTVVKDFSMSFDERPSESQLRSAAEAYISSSGIGIPKVGIDVSYENLADYEGYQEIALLEQVKLGDTVHVYFEPLNITATAKVTETYYNVLLDKYKKIRVGSVKATLSTIINEDALSAKQEANDTATEASNAIVAAMEMLSGADGGNIVINRNELTGKPYEILIMDTDDVNTARNVLRLNMNGLGLSTSGINGPYTAAITGQGIIATAVKTGILSDLYGNYSLDMNTGTVNMANANITGGTINIETANETNDYITLTYNKSDGTRQYKVNISTSFIRLEQKKYQYDSYTQQMELVGHDMTEITANGFTYDNDFDLANRHLNVTVDDDGLTTSWGNQEITIEPRDGIKIVGANGYYGIFSYDGIRFYNSSDVLIKSL